MMNKRLVDILDPNITVAQLVYVLFMAFFMGLVIGVAFTR